VNDHHHPHLHHDAHGVPAVLDRRAFLKLVGFSFGAAGLAGMTGCSRGPTQFALTLLEPDPNVVAGRAYWIASTSFADGSGAGLLVRCMDGRPIKLEGNPGHPVSRGGLTAAAQASILSLYDDHRLDGPQLAGSGASWDAVDAAMLAKLQAIRAAGGRVRLLTPTLSGPSTLAWIDAFLASCPGARHVMYDALSSSAQLDAWAAVRGVRALPRLDLSRAQVLASFDADLLGTGVSPAGHTADWAAARQPDASPPRMSRHWQFESRLSLTGARADRRVRLAPWETATALAVLGGDLSRRAGREAPGRVPGASSLPPATRRALSDLAGELWARRGESLVVCGRNDRDAQLLTCWINELLDAPGATLDLAKPSLQRRGDDTALAALRDELLAGHVDLLVVAGCNPAYDLPGFGAALARAGTLVSLASLPDETSALAHITCPEPHELERWDDAEPLAGVFTTTQPTLPPLRSTRTLRASLARWSGDTRDERQLLADHWRSDLAARRAPRSGTAGTAAAADTRTPADASLVAEPFDIWFASVLERGWVTLPSKHAAKPAPFRAAPVAEALERVAATAAAPRNATSGNATSGNAASGNGAPRDGALGLVLYAKVGLLDGRGAQNPWLQELPDPVSKIVWDNHADLAPATAARLGLSTGDIVRLQTDDGVQLELPVLVQPGQDERIVAVALGYGRLGTDRFTDIGPEWIESRPTVARGGTVGVNAAPLLALAGGPLGYDTRSVTVQATGAHRALACTQDHQSLSVPAHLAPDGDTERHGIVRVIAFPELVADPTGALAERHGPEGDLWPDDHVERGHRWGMTIDLAACTGCSACVVSCQAENNVPVVGRDEVERHREMSWLRIDRYYGELPDGEVEVRRQPMLCQHCGHAPCETVCPVLATTHSNEGLNSQVYNRCVGTRYCANNCPYKVRRFNWFEYAHEDRLQNMSLNPEVTIRSRGVMEKCSLCVQRIQAGKAAASLRGEAVRDGEILTACQQSCPAQAIVFGDLNDPASEVSRRVARARAYEVLGELNVQPSVRYLADVRNAEQGGKPRHG